MEKNNGRNVTRRIMKHIKNFNESVSLVQQKCNILEELATELMDLGLFVLVTSKPVYYDGLSVNKNTEIGVVIHDKDNKINSNNLLYEEFIQEFVEKFTAYGFHYNSISSGEKHCYIRFDKHGRKTDSPFLSRKK